MGSGAGGMIDILFFASGVYLIYTAVMSKKNGNIAGNVMLAKDVSESSIKDKRGFIEYMCKRILTAGVMIVIASGVHLVILAAIAIYTAGYLQGQKRFIKTQEKNNRKK